MDYGSKSEIFASLVSKMFGFKTLVLYAFYGLWLELDQKFQREQFQHHWSIYEAACYHWSDCVASIAKLEYLFEKAQILKLDGLSQFFCPTNYF